MLLTCPGCAKKLNVPESAAGKKVRCPGCKSLVALPSEPAPAPEREAATDGDRTRKPGPPPEPAEAPPPGKPRGRRRNRPVGRQARPRREPARPPARQGLSAPPQSGGPAAGLPRRPVRPGAQGEPVPRTRSRDRWRQG